MAIRNRNLVAASVSFVFVVTGSFAQDFPSRPIKIVHGSDAGAPQDVMLRELAQHMQQATGVSVVVEPRPGGSGQVAMAAVIGQPADGHTIFSDGTGFTAILQMEGAAYSIDSFRPLYRIQLDPFALYVSKDGDFGSLEEFVHAMRDNPGEVRIGGYGTGTPFQFTSLTLAEEGRVELTWVPYNSGTDAITAVMAGDLEAAMSNISVFERFQESTSILAVSAAERVEAFDHIPTFLEQGYPIERYHWRGMLVDADTPDVVVEQLHAIIGEAVATNDFQSFLARTSTLDGTMSVAEFESMVTEQAASDKERLTALGMIGE